MEMLFCVQIKQSSRSSHNTLPDLHNMTNAAEEEKSVAHADSSATFNATNALTLVFFFVTHHNQRKRGSCQHIHSDGRVNTHWSYSTLARTHMKKVFVVSALTDE